MKNEAHRLTFISMWAFLPFNGVAAVIRQIGSFG